MAKYIAAALAILIFLFYVGQFAFAWRAEQRVDYKIAQLRSVGQPIELEDLKHEPIPPDNDAATYLRQVRSELESIHETVESLATADQEQLDFRNHLTPKAREAISKAVTEHAHIFPVLERASACPDFDPALTLNAGRDAFYESFDRNVALMRYANAALRCHALLLLADGKPEEALGTSVTMLRLARLCERVPTIIGYLIALNCRRTAVQMADLSLRAGRVTSSSQEKLEAELARVDAIREFLEAFRNERALGAQMFRDFYDKLGVTLIRRPILWRSRMNDYYAFLTQFDEPMQLIAEPYSNVRERAAAHDDAQLGGVVSELLRVRANEMLKGSFQDIAMIRSLRVLNAVTRAGQIDPAAEPKLESLGLPAEVTIDPFTGESLKMLRLDSGWVIYSVGPDLKDEGGKIGPDRDVGLGPQESWVSDSDSRSLTEQDREAISAFPETRIGAPPAPPEK